MRVLREALLHEADPSPINEIFGDSSTDEIQGGMRDPKTSTGGKAIRLGLMHQTYLMQGQITHLLFKRGLIPRDLWKTEMSINAGLLAQPGVRQWGDRTTRLRFSSKSEYGRYHPWGQSTGLSRAIARFSIR